MNRNLLMFLTTIALFGACKHDAERVGLPGGQEIKIRYEVNQPGEVSRSGASGMAVGDVVHLYIAERTEEGKPEAPTNEDFYQMECAADGVLAFTDGEQHYYPAAPIDLYAFYQKEMTTECADVTAIDLQVYQDQTSEEYEWRSDFLYAIAANGFRNQQEPISMTFRHQFARLKFMITTDTPSELDLSTLTAVEVRNVIMDGTFNLQTGELTLGGAEDVVSARIPADLAEGVTAIVMPQTMAAGTQVFCFQIGGEEFIYEVPAEGITFEAGKQYNYDICLNRYAGLSEKEVVVNMTTEDWNEVEGGTIMISKGEAAPVMLKDVAEGVTITKADLHFGGTVVTDIAVTDNRMEFVFPRLVEDDAVLLEQACFYTAEGESFNYYFNSKELIGNGTDTLSLPAPKIGDSWGDGIVFLVGEVLEYNDETGLLETDTQGVNAYKGRILAAKALDVSNWIIDRNQPGCDELIGMSNLDDGAANLTALGDFITSTEGNVDNYPLYKAVSVLDNWYVPAVHEMFHILAHQEFLNAEILIKGGDELDWRGVNYITSTEFASYTDSENPSAMSICSVGTMSGNIKKASPAEKITKGFIARIVKAF